MEAEMLFWGRTEKKKMTKSNFKETCCRFSQFLKEKRSLGQLDAFKDIASSELDIIGANSFPNNMEKEKMSLKLFPMNNSMDAGAENLPKSMTQSREFLASTEEAKNATPSMTIFYGGKVLVFNGLPEDKAQEIMLVASRGNIKANVEIQTQTSTQTETQIHIQTPRNIKYITTDVAQGLVPQGPSSLYDLPLARRVSLHRFMEKRKHRIANNAPYHLQSSMVEISDLHPQKFNMMKSLYEPQQLELKL
ncbi:protein TIFY 10A-like [Amaranthus tricolor]|uniref:protein TIFY 10A-like n=1 Tax=Amaranthus tricolor TaxID=29722 RepID=UPI002586BBF7|nr:protein TIFY 10A-like [Amaranthus tricolor]